MTSPALRALLQSLQQQAAALPLGLRTLVAEIGDKTGGSVNREATSQIEEQYQQDVLTACRALVEGRYPFADSKTDMTLAEFGTVFGHGGVFDKFFSDHSLDKHVDRSGRRWALVPGSARISQTILDQFQAAHRVRDMFFAKGSQMPALDFFVTLANLDTSAKRFILQIDGQISEATPGPPKRWPVKWPGQSPGAAATFEERYLDPTALNRSGPWAWFRMIDATLQTSPDSRRTVLRVSNAFHQVQIIVEPSSALNNPFASRDWRQFSCGSS